jgi:transposase
MGYIKGRDRDQQVLFPKAIDDYVNESNPVRVIDAFTGVLDFKELGFERGEAAATGRPGYDPRLMMGLYIWGHLNQVRSSRRLEKECSRNLEVIWLMEDLRPDFKTIADFRKDNGKSIREVMVKFRLWCLEEGLYGGEIASIDGSKFEAVNSRDRNYNEAKLNKIIERERARVEKYLQEIEEADQQEKYEPKKSVEELEKALATMRERMARHEELLRKLKESGESQLSLTDVESRLMKTNNGGHEVSFNTQMVVDAENKLIVEFEVTNEGNDRGQLANMAKKGKEALLVDHLTVVADKGYFDGNTIRECEGAGITPYLPTPASSAEAKGVIAADNFSYDEKRDLYICPQGKELTFRTKETLRKKEYKIYRTNACDGCPIREQCTKSKTGRKLRRWVDQDVVDRLQKRMHEHPDLMKKRKAMAEHPFGTIKRAMNQGYFLMRGIKKVTIEMSLTVLAYNIKRAITILGVEEIVKSMRATGSSTDLTLFSRLIRDLRTITAGFTKSRKDKRCIRYYRCPRLIFIAGPVFTRSLPVGGIRMRCTH